MRDARIADGRMIVAKMDIPKIVTSIEEAKRFIVKANLAIKEAKLNNNRGGSANAAARRSSMDLTKALSDMRKIG